MNRKQQIENLKNEITQRLETIDQLQADEQREENTPTDMTPEDKADVDDFINRII